MLTKMIALLFAFSILTCGMTSPTKDGSFSLRILHTNDMHSRFEQISQLGGKCSDKDAADNKCYGGFARVRTAVDLQRQKAREENIPILFLNAGDTYQGTIWYTVYKWKVVARFLNMLSIDAMSLGNHEFDDGVAGLVPFLNNVSSSVVTCNLDLSEEPDLAETPLKPSIIVNSNGTKIGIIGYLTPETKSLSNTEDVEIKDEVSSITEEAKRLKAQGVDILIGVGHSGYDADLKIASEVPDIDVIIGGHTNTFLYTGDPPDSEIPTSLYPEIVTQTSGRKVAVVQAYAYGKYLGILNLKFDANGELSEAEGNPIVLDYKVKENEEVLAEIAKWRVGIDNITKQEIGKTKVLLDGWCRFEECNMGNLITDAYIDYGVRNFAGSNWTDTPIAIQQSGGIRNSIDSSSTDGSVTREDVMLVMPFYNALSILKLKGKHLREALEWSVFRYDPNHQIGRGEFLQVSGLQIVFDITKSPGSRLVSANVRCSDCNVPHYEPLNDEKEYNVIMPSFLARGGDNFTVFVEHGTEVIQFDGMDTDIVTDFIQNRALIYYETENRIVFGSSTSARGGSSSSFTVTASYLTLVSLLLVIFANYKFR